MKSGQGKILSKRTCTCGATWMALQYEGEKQPRIVHQEPVCETFKSKSATEFVLLFATSNRRGRRAAKSKRKK